MNRLFGLSLLLVMGGCNWKDGSDDDDDWDDDGSGDWGTGTDENLNANGGDSSGGTDEDASEDTGEHVSSEDDENIGSEDGHSEDGHSEDDHSTDPMTAALYGSIVDGSGAVMAMANVKLCTPLQCKTTEPDGDGNFDFVDIEGATFALEIKGENANSATVMGFIELAMEEVRTIEAPIVIPDFQTTDDLGAAGTINVDGGLNVTVDTSYEPPFGSDVEEKLKGVQMTDPASSGLPLDGIEGEVVALWYLGTWNTAIPDGWSFTIDSLEGVAEGDSLTVLTGDYFNSAWVNEGTASVGADGAVTADPGTGITFLSTLVLVK